ncbi:hypothetical protein GGF37_001515, partial [Kickxella alabastrina]
AQASAPRARARWMPWGTRSCVSTRIRAWLASAWLALFRTPSMRRMARQLRVMELQRFLSS